MLSLGLMSGTSMDGIDAAILETDGEQSLQEIAHFSLSYAEEFKILLKSVELSVRHHAGDLASAKNFFENAISLYLIQKLKLSEKAALEKKQALKNYLKTELTFDAVITHSTLLHAEAVEKLLEKAQLKATDIAVIGYHGQTFFHQPARKISIILGYAQQLADRTKIAVIADFRRKDIEAGGQGAPFAPLYHQALAARDHKIPGVVINCGGIANITLITSDDPLTLLGLDTGPGNGLIDAYVKEITQGQRSMDINGEYGQQGCVDESVLTMLYQRSVLQNHENYFAKPLPKSLDIGDMQLIPEIFTLEKADACRTLEAFTADSIVKSLETLVNSNSLKYCILAGGGWNNPVILNELKTRLHRVFGSLLEIKTAEEVGWSGQALEAQIFAYLAVRSLAAKYLSVPGTTGVCVPTTGGTLYRPI